MSQNLTIFAPAKINLFLHVTEKMDNGYHTLDSLISFANIGDEITIQPADQFSFTIKGPYAGHFTGDAQASTEKSTNLVVKAVFALSKALEKLPDFKITLTKNLPLSSGIGGGSANAAATIWGLMEWWKIPRDSKFLPELFLTLGADVPVCYYSQPARMQGIGDIITPVPKMPELSILLVNPGIPCSTQKIFTQYNPPLYSNDITMPSTFTSQADLIDFLKLQRNDLTETAENTVSEITQILSALNKQAGCQLSRLSGSGATCFGIFENEAAAQTAAKALSQSNPDWWIRASTLNQIERY